MSLQHKHPRRLKDFVLIWTGMAGFMTGLWYWMFKQTDYGGLILTAGSLCVVAFGARNLPVWGRRRPSGQLTLAEILDLGVAYHGHLPGCSPLRGCKCKNQLLTVFNGLTPDQIDELNTDHLMRIQARREPGAVKKDAYLAAAIIRAIDRVGAPGFDAMVRRLTNDDI